MKLKYHSVGTTDFILFEPELPQEEHQLELIIKERIETNKRFEAIRFSHPDEGINELLSLTLPIQKV